MGIFNDACMEISLLHSIRRQNNSFLRRLKRELRPSRKYPTILKRNVYMVGAELTQPIARYDWWRVVKSRESPYFGGERVDPQLRFLSRGEKDA